MLAYPAYPLKYCRRVSLDEDLDVKAENNRSTQVLMIYSHHTPY